MAELKTKAHAGDVDAFLDAVDPPQQREDAKAIAAMMARVSGQPAVMWGPAIVGFGAYHYRYDSGREGDMCRIGFSPRKGQTTLYIGPGFDDAHELLEPLGKHKTGVGCLYVKRLSDVDAGALEAIVQRAWDVMGERYPG
ncbi:DUF1801 domain-containing protein [Sphingomonas crocodyli]|uniref:DUF1801 domain-containing protein n=1 Tax=Sphingomonas crocodyli TaxID=1979270 RepID=A0A437MB81_9SPHN|nr:DUF1801 domain-containing protein [Sphingomonas crocodyli]RVT94876.1 DUF1801 domain-containing protein [Sphingomonas crocodyli]